VRERWARGEVVLDCWSSGGSPTTTEAIGKLGFDSMVIDMQHTLADFKDVAMNFLALRGTGTVPMVRVPWNDVSIVQRVLDAGAEGVMCPVVSNRAEAEQFIGAARYPPMGFRSWGPFRANKPVMEYWEGANEDIITFAQIETREGIANLDEIASTPGLDALFVGPADLSISHGGRPEQNYRDAQVAEHHKKIIAAAHNAGKKAGMLALTQPDVELAHEWGMDFLSIGMESAMAIMGARAVLEYSKPIVGWTTEAAVG
jgi:4-hydroxy-2-oxoheptanedioate aldolase